MKKILLIEDCAHAVGSEHIKKKAGSIGDQDVFLFLNKNNNYWRGGMLTTNNKKLFELALSLRGEGIGPRKIWNYINMIGEHVECLNSVHY